MKPGHDIVWAASLLLLGGFFFIIIIPVVLHAAGHGRNVKRILALCRFTFVQLPRLRNNREVTFIWRTKLSCPRLRRHLIVCVSFVFGR